MGLPVPWGKTLQPITVSTNAERQGKGECDTHRFISADGVYLGPKHNWGEDEKQESLKTQEDEENHCSWWREGTAFCEHKTVELEGQTSSNAPAAKHLLSHEFPIIELSNKLYEQHSQKDTQGSSDILEDIQP